MSTAIRRVDPQHYYAIQYRKWLAWPAYVLFFMMLFVPTSYQPIKSILLVMVVTIIGVTALVRGRLHLHMNVLLWTLFMVVTGLAFMALGVVNNASGALRVGTVYVLWPLVYTFLLAGVNSKNIIDGVFKLMVFSLIAISLYSILYLLYAVGWLPDSLYFELDMGQRIGVYEGYVEYNLYNISSLNFLVPFLIAMVVIWPKGSGAPISKLWLWLACMLGVAVAILSGRRAVWLMLVISPLVVMAARMCMVRRFRIASSRKFRRLVVGLATMVGGLFLYGSHVAGLDISMIWRKLMSGLRFSGGGVSEPAREEQFFALLDGWQQNPLFGAGHGASVTGSLRSIDMPWAYELSYVALLFHTGLVGFLVYGAGVIWIFWMGLKIMRSGHWLGIYMLPVLIGTFCFLIANATNPYLAKFDYLWVIFLPVALINTWLLDKDKTGHLQGESCPHH